MLATILPSASPHDLRNQALLNRIRRASSRAAVSNPRILGVHPSPPSITDHGASSPEITASNSYSCNGSNRGVWHVIGGQYGSGGRIRSGIQDAGPTDINSYARWEVMADCRYFTARLGPTIAPYRFIIDGQFISRTGTLLGATTGSTDQYVLLDFGTRAIRRIVVEATRTGRLAGGFVEAGAALWPVDASEVPHAVFLGDSYVFGSGPDIVSDGVAVQMADRMGLALQASGSGGTGWNQTSKSVYRFDQRISNGDLGLSYHAPEVIFLHASVNDAYSGQNSDEMHAQVLAGLRSIRAQFPTAPIVVFGCVPVPNRSGSLIAQAEASVAAAVAEMRDAFCRFVPIDSDPAGKWISGQGAELRFTDSLASAASATLASAWPAGTSTSDYTILFSDGSTRVASFIQGGTSVSWNEAVTASATAMVRQVEGNARFAMCPDWIHPSNYGAAYLGERYARGALAALEAMLG